MKIFAYYDFISDTMKIFEYITISNTILWRILLLQGSKTNEDAKETHLYLKQRELHTITTSFYKKTMHNCATVNQSSIIFLAALPHFSNRRQHIFNFSHQKNKISSQRFKHSFQPNKIRQHHFKISQQKNKTGQCEIDLSLSMHIRILAVGISA